MSLAVNAERSSVTAPSILSLTKRTITLGSLKLFYFAGSPVERSLSAIAGNSDNFAISPAEVDNTEVTGWGVVLVDGSEAEIELARRLKTRLHHVQIVVLASSRAMPSTPHQNVYLYIPRELSAGVQARLLSNTFSHVRLLIEQEQAQSDITQLAQELTDLNKIGVRLSAERDTNSLLDLILRKAREITRADAGSLYLIEEDENGNRQLRFKATMCDSVEVPFREFTLPISHQSLAGHVALTGEIQNLDDAYSPPQGSPFTVNTAFDRQIGYRTKSMLVVPLKTPQGEIIGVFQLINRKPRGVGRFNSVNIVADIEERAVPFSARAQELASSLASQAAVAVENSRLYKSIETLFEGFVSASVSAIEARDPTTAGHSFRVAELTVALAEIVDRADSGAYRTVRFTPDEMKEIRYASILHDFGKVGVRDNVLVKAKKLWPEQLDAIRQRAEIIRRGVELRASRKKLDYLLAEGRDRFYEFLQALDGQLVAQFSEIESYIQAVLTANEPAVMPEAIPGILQQMALNKFEDHEGKQQSLLTAQEAWVLSIPRGSLTQDERREIESHVSLTYKFLCSIPWTKTLRRVPEIAHAHHERLNGTGYPRKLKGEDIPVQSKLMMITDVYDALSAADRPYKKAVPLHRALDILTHEKNAGMLDSVLVDLFISQKVYERTTPRT
jgi:HD-GYP domain-containing protein (c-di-GMP phosphodiesterase class II)